MSWLLDRTSRLFERGFDSARRRFVFVFRFVSGSVNSRDPEASNCREAPSFRALFRISVRFTYISIAILFAINIYIPARTNSNMPLFRGRLLRYLDTWNRHHLHRITLFQALFRLTVPVNITVIKCECSKYVINVI